jgi:hypothetical protein
VHEIQLYPPEAAIDPSEDAAAIGGALPIWRYPGVTQTANQNGLPEGKPLICLVAGARFELATFEL